MDKYDIVEILLEYGANKNVRNKEGDSALNLADYQSDHRVYNLIFEHNFKVMKGINILSRRKVNLTLPEDVVCFDEIKSCEVLVKDFIKTYDTEFFCEKFFTFPKTFRSFSFIWFIITNHHSFARF